MTTLAESKRRPTEELPRTESLFQALETQYREIPENIALIYEDSQISYENLYKRCAAVAKQLHTLGVKKGDRVALLFPNHPEFVSAFFAVVGLGAAVVPVNPLLKSDEIAHILSDSQAKLLLVEERCLAEALAALGGKNNQELFQELEHIIVCKHDRSLALPKAELAPKTIMQELTAETSADFRFDIEQISKEDLALIVYTSGTTGKPKGALLTHSGIVSSIKESLFDGFDINKSDRFLGALPLCHIYGAGVLVYFNIARGTSLVILPKFEAKKVLELLSRHRVTILPLVPTMYQFLLMEMQEQNYDTSSLRICFCAAAPLSAELHKQIEDSFGVQVYEGYALSETACGGTINPYKARKQGSIGKPINCLEITIRSEDGKALPAGAENIGEIAVRGPNVMLGYHGKPEATAEVFADGGWFLTGDLGYKDEEGYLYIAGRKKELIIRGGSNIYPREVEEVIARLPQVADVAVVGVPDKLMGERVKAVIVRKQGQELDEEQVKNFCAEHLAQYKVPRLVEFRNELPRNSTGKVLKRALV